MNYTVYMHICPNGKKYVGITRLNPKKRWCGGSGYKSNEHFTNAIQKYGWGNIEHKIMANWCTKEYAQLLERKLIQSYKTMNNLYGYNKTSGGEEHKKLSSESRKKISEANKGKCAWNKGLKFKQELTNEEENMKKMIKERNVKEGHKKISLRLKGRKISEEHKEKLREAKLGTTHSKHTKEKLRKLIMNNPNHPFNKPENYEHQKRRIFQYTLDGLFVKEWESIKEAQTNLRDINSPCIIQSLRGTRKTAYGYVWKYADEKEEI